MNVADAIDSRMSCRAFLPTPVPESTVRRILEQARRAPSGGNLQPWHVHVLSGTPLAALVARVREQLPQHPLGEAGEYDVYPSPLQEPYRTRRSRCGEDLYALLGIVREDRLRRLRQYGRNFELFGAPVGMFFSLDRGMGAPQWADVGMFMQNIMLLAREHGLHTCAQESWSGWHRIVREQLQLPAARIFFCGMALGYCDETAAVNRLRTERAELAEFASLSGF